METVNGVPEGDKGGPPPPSPLTGCYLLIVVGEPYTEQHKDIILQRIAKGLLSWEINSCLVDLEKELGIITEQALDGEEARYGERLIQFASENLVTEILIHPVVSTLAQCMRNLLSSFTRHRHIIHSGYTFAANGSWALQDGTFSYSDFSEAFQEIDVQRVIHAYENGISVDLHCSPEGEWTRLPKEQFAKACKARVNPSDVLTSGSPAITSFTNYLAPFLVPTSLENLLESSDVVGNIRFSRPTLYVFPGGQGDAALFGINGFNMLLDGGFSRKACFWDFVRHLDRLDAVLMTRLNNSNVGGIGSVLRRKKQDAVYPQLGHFFCNIQERRALLSPDGDKDKDPLLINLLDEGQEIISNLRHLNLNPQVCYRDSEPINLYHKVGHGTLDMYVLSPAKDSKEVREFLQKWNQCDQKLFANIKSTREFSFPIQNLISIAALLVWQPADPNDTITRILFPGSSPQNKIFEGLDRLKNLDFIKHSVCTERSLAPISITKKTAKDPILEKVTPKEKTPVEKKDNKIIENNVISAVNGDIKEKTVKKSDSTESERSTKTKKTEETKIIENGDKSKPKLRTSKSRSGSQQRKRVVEKKASPTTPKKIVENGESKKPSKPSPISTPAKSAKDANNRKVIESKAKREGVVKPQLPPEPKPKVERKPISRRPAAKKAPLSPAKKLVSGVQKPDSISRKGKLDKEGTTDSSTVSTPSADQETVLKKDLSKLTPDEIQQLKAQELADLKEEQEAIKEIEAVFKKGESLPIQDETLRRVKDDSIDETLNKEEYLIVEKEEIEHESLSETKENETRKLARDSEESEKQRKLSTEDKIEDISVEIKKESQAEDLVKSRVDALESGKVSLEDKLDISTDKKTNGKEAEDDVKDVMESQPDEKISANIKSGDTTTAPTLPEDERIPLDEIKEDNGHAIEEKYVKEETKEKEIPVIQLPQKQFDNVSKLPGAVGIRLDKQQHIRDIVKTPDEVADLPVHEEVDYEYTHELKAELPKSNEIFEDHKHPETTRYSKEQEKGVEQEKDKDEVIQDMIEQIENISSSIPECDLKVRDDVLKHLEKDEKKGLDGKEHGIAKTEYELITDEHVEKVTGAETSLEGLQSTKNIVDNPAEQQYEGVLELKKEIKTSEDKENIDKASEHVQNEEEKTEATKEKGEQDAKSEQDTKDVPCQLVEEKVSEERDNVPILPTVTEVKTELNRINEGVLKAAKEDQDQLEKLDEKLQQLKQSQMEDEEDKRHFSTIQSEKSAEKSIEKATDELMEDFIMKDTVDKIQPKSPVEMIEKGELGSKSPKEREEDVIKIVASVAEVLKSDAPLEEFEGKLPITTTISSYTSPYTTELRETHITTVDSPVIEYKVIKTDIPTIPEEPHFASASFIEEEKKISKVHGPREEKPEDKRSSLLKESQELMMTTSKMISDIKSAKSEEIAKEELSAEKVDAIDSTTATDEKIEVEESGIIHRMLVTASSEDGGEETEICPPGTIIFPKSPESSGRSSPDPSQKVSQKSSVVEAISDTLSTVKKVAELQSEKELGIVGKSEGTISPLPELRSAGLSDGPSAVLEKSDEISSQIMTSGKSSPDKDASIKSLASGKSTPDMSDLEKFKEVTSSSEDLKKDDDARSIKESHSDKSVSETPVVGEKDVKTQTVAITEQANLGLEQPSPEEIAKSEEDDQRQKSVVDIVEDTLESGIAAITEFTKSIFSSDDGDDKNVRDHVVDEEITNDVTAAVKDEIGGEMLTQESDRISEAMTQSVTPVAKDDSLDDKLSHDDESKVIKEPEVPKSISVGEDKKADVEVSQVESIVEGIGKRIGDAFDAVAEFIHPAEHQIDVTETNEKTIGPEEVIFISKEDEKQGKGLKSAEVKFTEEQNKISSPKEEHKEPHVSHEVSQSPQNVDEKLDYAINKKKDAGKKIGEELKVSLDKTVEALDDEEKNNLQEPLLDEDLTKPDISIEMASLEDSIIVSKSPGAIEIIETTIISDREPPEKYSELVKLKTEIEDSKSVLEAIQKGKDPTEITKMREDEVKAVESLGKSVDALPDKIEDIVKDFPSTEEKHVRDIPETGISKVVESSEISTSEVEKGTALDRTDISEKSIKDEQQPTKHTAEINSSLEKKGSSIDDSPEIHYKKKTGSDDIHDESYCTIEGTSMIISEQLDGAESEISKQKETKDGKQTTEQTTEIGSSPEKEGPVTDHKIETTTEDATESEISKLVSPDKPTTDEKHIFETSEKKEESKGEKNGITFDEELSQVKPLEDKDKLATTGVKDVLKDVKHDLQDIADKVTGVITSEVESTEDEINILKENVKTSAFSLYEEVKDISKGMLCEAKKLFDETTYSISTLPKVVDHSVENSRDESGVMEKDIEKSVGIESTLDADKPIEDGRTDPSEVIKILDDFRSPVRKADDEKHEKGIDEESKEIKFTPHPQKETFIEISSLPLSVPSKSEESVTSNQIDESGRRDEKGPYEDFKKIDSIIQQHEKAIKDISGPHLLLSKGGEIVHEEPSVEEGLMSGVDGIIEPITKCEQPGMEKSLESQFKDNEENIPDKIEILKETSNKLKDTTEKVEDMSKSIIFDKSQKTVTKVEESSKGDLARDYHEMKKNNEVDSTPTHINSTKVQELDDSTKLSKDSRKENLSNSTECKEPIDEVEFKKEVGEVLSKSKDFGTVDSSKSESPKELSDTSEFVTDEIEIFDTTEKTKKSSEVPEEIKTSAEMIERSGEAVGKLQEREKAESEKSTTDFETRFETVEQIKELTVLKICEPEQNIESADLGEKLKDVSQKSAGEKRITEIEELHEEQIVKEESEDMKRKLDGVEAMPKLAISETCIKKEILIDDDSIKTSKEEQNGKSDAEKDVDEIERCKDVAESSEVKLEQSATDIEKIYETVQDLSRSVIFETCDSRDKNDDDQNLGDVSKEQEKILEDPSEESIKLLEGRKSVVAPEKKQEEYYEKSDSEKHVDEEKKSDQATKDGEACDINDSEKSDIEKVTDELKKYLEEQSEYVAKTSVDEDKKADKDNISKLVIETCETKERSEPSTEMRKEVHHEKSDSLLDDIIKHQEIQEEPGKPRTDTFDVIQDAPQFEEKSEDSDKILLDIYHKFSDTKSEADVGKESKHEKTLLEDSVVPKTSVEICEQADKLSTDIRHDKSNVKMKVDIDSIANKVLEQERATSEKSEKILKDTSEAVHDLLQSTVPVLHEKTCEESEKTLTDLHLEKSDAKEQINAGKESKQEETILEKMNKQGKDSFESCENILGKTEEITMDAHHEGFDDGKKVSEAVTKLEEVILTKSDEHPNDTTETTQDMSQSIVTETSEGTCEGKVSKDVQHEKFDAEKTVDLEESIIEKQEEIQGMSQTAVSETLKKTCEETEMVDIKPDSETKVVIDLKSDESIEQENEILEKPDIPKDTSEEVQDVSETVVSERIYEESEKTPTGVYYEKSDGEKSVENGIESKQEKLVSEKHEKSLKGTYDELKDMSQSLTSKTTEGACQKSEEISEAVHHGDSAVVRKVEADPRLHEVMEKYTSGAVKDESPSLVPEKSVERCEESDNVNHTKDTKQEKSIREESGKLLEDTSEEAHVMSQAVVSESCKKTQESDFTDKEKSDPEKHVGTACESREHMEDKKILLKEADKESNKSIIDDPILEKQDAPTEKVSETLGQVGDTSVCTRKDDKCKGSDAEECTEKCIEHSQICSDTKKQDAENIFSSTIDEGIGHKSVELEKGEDETMEKCDKECKPDSGTTQQKTLVEELEETPIVLAGPSIAEKSKAEVQKQIEIQETLLHEKHIPGAVTPPTVPVSPNILDESMKFSAGSQALMKEVDLRSITPVSDDSEIIGSTQTDISEQVSKVQLDKESDDDDPLSIMSQIAHSRDSSHCEFDDDFRKVDPMSMSMYGSLPGEISSEQGSGPSILVETEKTKHLALSEDKTDLKLAERIDDTKSGSSHIDDTSSSSKSQENEDSLESWGKPLGLPAPTYLYEITQAKFSRGVHSISHEEKGSAFVQHSESEKEESPHFRNEQLDVMSASFYGDLPSDEKDPLSSWGKPLGLPSPAPPNDNKGTPKKERKLPPNVSAKNKLNDDRKRAESPSKYNNRNKKITPVYVDLTYVPHHGNTNYSYVDFFKRVRARYYVFSGIEPSRDVYNALLEAKQTWEDKDLEVTIIPTYDTDILGFWVAENEEMLSKYKIDLSPSASRCTINLQDHETSCSAYRLEF